MRLAALPLAAIGGLLALGHARGADGADGEWSRDDGLVRARIASCGGAVCATNTWVKNPDGDEKIGDKLVLTLTRTDESHWTGSAFDPKRHLDFSMEMRVAGDRLTTRGCVFAGFVCRDVGWTRFNR